MLEVKIIGLIYKVKIIEKHEIEPLSKNILNELTLIVSAANNELAK